MGDGAAPKMTMPTMAVLRALLERPAGEMYGLEISASARLATGTIHPILARLESVGWLESRWEDIDPRERRRPRRRYYRLSESGAEAARNALASADLRRSKFGTMRPEIAPGGVA